MGEGTGSKFLRGALILSIAGLTSKLIGSVYRVVLTRILGAEGIGLFELAYPIYVTLLTISRSGIPVALARLVASDIALGKRSEALSTFRTARFLALVIGLAVTVLLMAGSKSLISLLGWDPRVLPSILAIAPAIFFVSVMASYRGYFQGFQRMGPTGFSQVVEQFVRMVSMIILVFLLLPLGVEFAAAGATFGAVSGAIGGLFVMLYYFRKSGHAPEGLGLPGRNEIKLRTGRIFEVALPVTFGAMVFPLMRLVDAVIIPSRLQFAGWTAVEATSLYGILSTALVLVNFPTILTISLAASLVPSISEDYALGNREVLRKRVDTALRIALIIGIPSAVGLVALALPLTDVIMGLPEAAVPLRIVGWGVLFMALQQTSSAILQGAGRPRIPAFNLFWGALLNGVINFTLTSIPEIGINGAALGTTMGFALAAVLNLICVHRHLGYSLNTSGFLPVPISSLGMYLVIWPVGKILEDLTGAGYVFGTLLTVILGMIVFFVLLLLTGGIKDSDFNMIPRYGDKLRSFLRRNRLWRG